MKEFIIFLKFKFFEKIYFLSQFFHGELEYHEKLDFAKLKYPKNKR